MQIFNTFAFREKKDNILINVSKPVYKHGEYSVFKIANKWYAIAKNGIIVGERMGVPKELISSLVRDERPATMMARFHFDKMKNEYEKGVQYAKEYGFRFNNND